MNKYILMLGIAAVALGRYAAYAGNTATMTVTATIAHDVSLSVTQDIDLGTITINPADADNDGWIYYNLDGTVKSKSDPITAAPNATLGTFTANIANPSACDGSSNTCGGLMVPTIGGIFGGSHTSCRFVIEYGTLNEFRVVPTDCDFVAGEALAGTHTQTITISYTAS
ncbi:MAG: hypothetical protein IJ689_07975 [Alphaproteobacteria bacterium]|nr:hypothetical protein [Alphaproteobacteria bacterium]